MQGCIVTIILKLIHVEIKCKTLVLLIIIYCYHINITLADLIGQMIYFYLYREFHSKSIFSDERPF